MSFCLSTVLLSIAKSYGKNFSYFYSYDKGIKSRPFFILAASRPQSAVAISLELITNCFQLSTAFELLAGVVCCRSHSTNASRPASLSLKLDRAMSISVHLPLLSTATVKFMFDLVGTLIFPTICTRILVAHLFSPAVKYLNVA
ncbi:hypothetical protein NIES3974_28250 [Calothrix sp. NIES-3974]|nr:hypothetical protein NIES3974_28250 [Calothrix sp. NIES-3974]